MAIPYYESYKNLPSAFNLIEWPLYYLNESINTDMNAPMNMSARDKEINSVKNQLFESFKQRNFSETYSDFKRLFSLYDQEYKFARMLVVSMFIGPITLALTPATLCTDLLVGGGEAVYAGARRFSKRDIQLILLKKWIASPIQHLTYFLATGGFYAAVGTGVFIKSFLQPEPMSLKGRVTLMLLCGGMFSGFIYGPVQALVGRGLPSWTRPEGFNIFINGGAPDRTGRKYTEARAEEDYAQYRAQNESKPRPSEPQPESPSNFLHQYYMNEWKTYLNKNAKELSRLAEETPFAKFNNLCVEKATREKLLDIESEVTAESIKKAYKKLALWLHPDRHPGDLDRANLLFKALSEARLSLELEHKLQ